MKKTCFIFSEFNIGGMETSVIRIARSMIASKKYDIVFVTTERRSSNIPKDIKYIHIDGFNKFFPYFHFCKVLNTIKKLNISTYLIVYERVFQSVAGLIKGTKICLLRNNHSEVYKRAFTNYTKIDGFIGNSPANKFFVDDYNKNVKKFFKFIPNGIKNSKNNLLKKRKKNLGILNLLFVGRIVDDSKGVFGLYEICQELIKSHTNFKLRIIGEGSDLIKLKSLFKDDCFFNKIIFKPFLEKVDLIHEYNKADILLMPSNYEGLPNVLLEAMLYGCVPVATLLKDSTDIVIKNKINGFLFNKRDFKQVADIIKTLDNNRNILHNMSNSAIENIHINFSSEREFIDYDEAISEINKQITQNNSFSYSLSLKLFNPISIFGDIVRIILKKINVFRNV